MTLSRPGKSPAGMVFVAGAAPVVRSRHRCLTSGWTATKSRTVSSRPSSMPAVTAHREYLDAAVHQGRSSDCLGGRHCPVPRFHGPARTGRMGAEFVSRRGRRTAGGRRQLVRGRGLRRVRGQEPPDLLALEQSRRAHGVYSGHPAPQQLQRERTGEVGRVPGARRVRHVRHGRQRQGVVPQQHGLPPLHPRRRLERTELHVHGPRRAGPVRASPQLRIPVREVSDGTPRHPHRAGGIVAA